MSKERKSEPGSQATPDPEARDENFLQRWSRRKAAARDGLTTEAEDPEVVVRADPGEPVTPAETESQLDQSVETEPAAADAPGDEDMPAIEDLSDDDDYSAFFSPRVSPDLRKKALARLFSSPKFNIRDGLDDYDDDYTTYKSLGDTITAEMRHRAEDLLRRQMEAAEQAIDESSKTDAEEDESMAVGSDDRDRHDSLDETDESSASDSEEERKNDA